MEKRKKIIAVVLTLVLVLCFLASQNTLSLGDPDYAVITYSYGDVYFWQELYGKEVDDVVKILNGEWEYTDNPSCGFSEDISITISGYTFALARDKCGVVKNCTTGKYIFISDSERAVLEALFTSRGGRFPCV